MLGDDDTFDQIVGVEEWPDYGGLRMTPQGVILVSVMEHVENFTLATTIASDIYESLLIHGYDVVDADDTDEW